MKPWREKANREIERLCRESYLHMNQYSDGTMRRKHVPYSVPAIAKALVDCLNRDDEETAKAIFVKLACVPEWENDPSPDMHALSTIPTWDCGCGSGKAMQNCCGYE